MMDDKEYIMVTPLMKNGTIVDFLKKNVEANPLKLASNAFHFVRFLTESSHSWRTPCKVFSISTA